MEQLHIKLAAKSSAAAVDVLLLSRISLQAAASAVLRGEPPVASFHAPVALSPLFVQGGLSRLRVAMCLRWSIIMTAHNIRVLWIPSLRAYLGTVIPSERLSGVLKSLLSTLHPRAQLHPPPSWSQLEQKELVFQHLSSFMLPSSWEALASADEAAAKLLDRADGDYVVKGSFSHGIATAQRVTITAKQCPALLPILRSLQTTYQQRCVGIQPFVSMVRTLKQRVFLVPDRSLPAGWRQCIHVQTRGHADVAQHQLQLPTSGFPFTVAQFVDRLLKKRSSFFASVSAAGVPLLRLDCCFKNGDVGCFLTELSVAGGAFLFTDAHGQDLARVEAAYFAGQMWQLMQ